MKTNSDEWIKSKSFKRNLSSDLINKLQKEPLYIDYLKADIFDHYVFPTIRINNIGFYTEDCFLNMIKKGSIPT